MKKIILIISLFVGITAKGQTVQSVNSVFDGKLYICYDTTARVDFGCDLNTDIDSIAVSNEFVALFNLCERLSNYDLITSFICQNTLKQSLTHYKRLIVIDGKNEQKIFSIELLNQSDIDIYNEFINKIKTLL